MPWSPGGQKPATTLARSTVCSCQRVCSSCSIPSPGHKVHQTIYMINSEKEAFSFAFRESSLFSEGCNTFVKIEPLEGSIAPLSR